MGKENKTIDGGALGTHLGLGRANAANVPIIVHCHLNWDGVWQRPQQFHSRLCQHRKILFVESPRLLPEDILPSFKLVSVPSSPNLTIMQSFFPESRFADGPWIDRERLRVLQEALSGPLQGQFEGAIQWFYDPMAAPCFIGKLGERAVVYDCMDELSQFKFAHPELRTRERFLLDSASLVFTGGRKLYQSKSRFNTNCHFYGCGVDVDHFAKAQLPETQLPLDLQKIPEPRLGYFGVIDERIDYVLLEKLADHKPDWSIVMIGPVVKVDPQTLPQRSNLHWLGGRPYADLPAYTRGFNVCLMPFAINEATEFINPTKSLEYMATARPIVSSAVPDVVSNFSNVVQVAHSHEEFVRWCEKRVEQRDEKRIQDGLALARENTWEAIVAALERHLADALEKPWQNEGSLGASPKLEGELAVSGKGGIYV